MTRTLLALAALLLLAGCADDTPAGAPAPTPTSVPAASAPASYDDLPEGPATALPWWDAGVLHVDGGTIGTTLRLLVHRGGTTVVGRSSVATGADWELVRDGVLVPLVAAPTPVVPRVSPDGGLVAWVKVEGDEQQVTVYDVVGGGTATWSTTQEVACCDGTGSVSVLGVDAAGRVLLGGVDRGVAVWTPGREPVRVRDGVVPAQDQWPLGVSWQAPGSGPLDSVSAFGTLDDAGRVERVGEMTDDQTGLWSADGTAYAHSGTGTGEAPLKAELDHWWVTGTDGAEVELLVPTDELLDLVAWELPTAVVLPAPRPYGDPEVVRPGFVGLLRCDTATGACERVAAGPARGSRLPERAY